MSSLSATSTLVLIRGAGDLASGTAHRLFRCGFRVVMTEVAEPLAVRRSVAFATAVYEGTATVCGVTARVAESVPATFDGGWIPVLVDPEASCRRTLSPPVLVDARLLKKGIETRLADAPLVIGLGPGFTAGVHAHAVIETNRGHDLGRIVTEGEAEPDTGIPGDIDGVTWQRFLRAPTDGVFESDRRIGDAVAAGDRVGSVQGAPVVAAVSGILRGLLRPGLRVPAGMKLGDVDPRARREHCFTLSDKARTVSGAVLEAILAWLAGRQ
ncbi:MAG: EF2563 family selenium-dependent molybdenum hydroxylase system protein [Candidatus Riflebacteria bacterium]|nr:EF2563 family selenium-dependent molybdenum hydroxylase system protein [Candidatus Riflebacteria bacterium]